MHLDPMFPPLSSPLVYMALIDPTATWLQRYSSALLGLEGEMTEPYMGNQRVTTKGHGVKGVGVNHLEEGSIMCACEHQKPLRFT